MTTPSAGTATTTEASSPYGYVPELPTGFTYEYPTLDLTQSPTATDAQLDVDWRSDFDKAFGFAQDLDPLYDLFGGASAIGGYAEDIVGVAKSIEDVATTFERVWEELTDIHTWISIAWLLFGLYLLSWGIIIFVVGDVVVDLGKAFGGSAGSAAKGAAAGAGRSVASLLPEAAVAA